MYELQTKMPSDAWISMRQDGFMFNVQTVRVNNEGEDDPNSTEGPDGITILGLNIVTPLTGSFCLELYTKPGSFGGFGSTISPVNNRGVWTFLGSFSVMGQGLNNHTPIPIGSFDPVTISADEVQAFYVTMMDENMVYWHNTDGITNNGGTTPNHTREIHFNNITDSGESSEHGLAVEIMVGGAAKAYPFSTSYFWPSFDGGILYNLGQDSSLSFLTDDQMDEARSVMRGRVFCDANPDPNPQYPPPAAKYFDSDPPVEDFDRDGTQVAKGYVSKLSSKSETILLATAFATTFIWV